MGCRRPVAASAVPGTVERPYSSGWTTGGANMLDVGTKAPDFSAPDQDGELVTLDSLRGHWVALWWYPMASTPG